MQRAPQHNALAMEFYIAYPPIGSGIARGKPYGQAKGSSRSRGPTRRIRHIAFDASNSPAPAYVPGRARNMAERRPYLLKVLG
jgi:hypothetical protein